MKLIHSLFFFIGVADKLDDLNQLKVKGLVIGPLHTAQANEADALNLQQINVQFGDENDLVALLEKAHKKSRSFSD